MKKALTEQDAEWIRCPDRPYSTEVFEVDVPTDNDVYLAMVHLVKSIYSKDLTCLVFLPGKSEIDRSSNRSQAKALKGLQ